VNRPVQLKLAPPGAPDLAGADCAGFTTPAVPVDKFAITPIAAAASEDLKAILG
jgi:hypothetical protein